MVEPKGFEPRAQRNRPAKDSRTKNNDSMLS